MRLSRRQIEVGDLLATGLSLKRIAERLGITCATARGHASLLYAALDVHDRVNAVLRLQELGQVYKPTEAEGPLSQGLKAYLRAFDRLLLAREDVPTRAREMAHMRDAAIIDGDGFPPPEGNTPRRYVRDDLSPLLANLDEYQKDVLGSDTTRCGGSAG